MALTRSDIPDLLLPGLKAEFQMAYQSMLDDSVADQIATVINTTLPNQTYSFLGASPAMREFLDERRPQGLQQSKVTISDKVFEATLAVERRAIEDDQFDLIRMRVRDMANRVATHRHQLVVTALTQGNNNKAYDGLNFFGPRVVLNETVSNYGDDVLSAGALAEAMSSMMLLKDDQGVPLGIKPDTLVVGPNQMWAALELLESPVVIHPPSSNQPSPYKNVFQGRLNLVVSPFIRDSGQKYWFLLDTQRAIRPVVLQQRSDVPVEFSALESASGSESAFMRDTYYYGVRGRYNVGYGLWQAAFGSFPE